MKTNVIYNGDCLDILNKKVDEKSVDLIFADPPYNLSGNGLQWKGNKTGGDWYMVNEQWDKVTAPEYRYSHTRRSSLSGRSKAVVGLFIMRK